MGFRPGSRGEWSTTCPHCQKPEKLVLNVEKRRWHCWVCQREMLRVGRGGVTRRVTVVGGGGLLRLFVWFYRISSGEAADWAVRVSGSGPVSLALLPNLDLAVSDADDDDDLLVPPPPPEGACPVDDDTLSFLASRRISVDVARAYGLFGCRGGRFDRRVVFPAWGPSGELLYWQARATWSPAEDERRGRRHIKVLNPERGDDLLTSEHTVFNLCRAVQLGRGRVALCEGPISAIHAGDDAVALWGKQLYPAQIRALLVAGVREVEVMFDGPTAREPEGAWPEAVALVPFLSSFFERVWLVRVPEGDPGDHCRAQNAEFRRAATLASRAGVHEI